MRSVIQALLLVAAIVTLPVQAVEVLSLQRGEVVSNGNGVVTVALGQVVDPSRTVLFFSSRHNSDRPPGSMIRGRLADATSLRFERVTNENSTMTIGWTLIEFVSGVTVQRGSFNMTSSVQNVALAQSVASTSQAFVLWSKTPAANHSVFSQDDPIGGYLFDSSTLRFLAQEAGGAHVVDYQVVEYTNPADLFVQSGVTAMSNGATTLDISLPATVNPATSMVLAGYSSNGTGNQIARRMLNVELRSPSSVRFARERSGSGIADVVWQVVEFRDGTSVQQGMETFSAGEAVCTVSLGSSVDPAAAVAFSGMQPAGGLNMGSSAYQSNDIIGTGSYTFDLASDSIALRRNNVAADSTVGWSVVSFSNLAPVLDLRMDELLWNGAAGEVIDSASGFDATAVDGATTSGVTPALAGNPGTCRYGNFDGVNDHLVVPDDPSLNGSSALVYSAWINPRSWSGVRQVMAKSVHGGGSGRAQMGIFSESNRLVLRAETLGGRREATAALPALDAWSHVVGVFAGDELRLYINGVLSGSSSFSSTSLRQTTDPLLISKRVGSAQYFFDGFIDEVRVYTQVLDANDVAALMAETHPCPNAPTGNWYFDEVGWNGTADEVQDYSGNDYDGRALNVTTGLGRVCNAADMSADTNTDYLSLDSAAFDGLQDFTIAVWYKGAHAGQMTIVSGARAGQFNELIFFFDRTNRFRPYLFGSSSGGITTPDLMDGDWHFLAWTRAGASNCLYLDDVLRGCVSRPLGPLSIAPGALIIGQEQDRLGGGFVTSQDLEGELDELLLFDTALGADELAQIRANNIAGLNWDGSPRSCPVTGATGFVLNHDGQGIHCADEAITVSAVDALSQLVPSYVNEITLQTSTGRGSWSLLAGSGLLIDSTADDGQAVYGFSGADNGSVTFALSYPEGDALVDIEVYQSNDVTVRDDDADGLLQFAPSGFTLSANALSNPPPSPISDPLPAQVAGSVFPLHLSAYGVTDDDPQCGVIESYTGDRELKFSMTHHNPATSPRVVTIDGQAAVTNPALASAQAVNFVAGQAVVAVQYKDVGEISLRAEDDVSFPQPLAGATNNFVVKPASLAVTRIESAGGDANPAAADMTGDGFVPAGESFLVEVSSLDSEGDVTPSFGRESSAERVSVFSPALLAPVSGRNGSTGDVNNGASFTLSAMPGVMSNSSISFDETGIISLRPVLVDADYLGAGDVPGIDSGNVGRFYPARFERVSDSVSAACNGFTYMGQPALNVVYRLQAQNAGGNVTWNYDNVDLGAPVASVVHVAENANDGLALSSRLSTFAADWDDGEYAVSAADVSFARLATADGPFTDLQLGLQASDPLDLVPLAAADMNVATAGDCVLAGDCDAVSLGSTTAVHYGRLLVLPSYGPEDRDLPVGLEVQSFANGEFRQHVADNCSVYSAAMASLSNLNGNLASVGTTVLGPPVDTAVRSGAADPDAPLSLAAPGIGYEGSVDVELDVGPWLEFNWLGTGDEDPQGTATFGRYRGHDRIIFRLEKR